VNILAWTRIAAALEWYRNLGYQYAEVPWICQRESVEATIPERELMLWVSQGDRRVGALIGSGEQGFIELLLQNKLPSDKLMTVTPCFRVEPNADGKLLLPWFMKLELFSLTLEPRAMAEDAMRFMRRWHHGVYLQPTQEGIDLVSEGVELGSYGFRVIQGQTITYGTGLAEPRFTNALLRAKP
jgi:hypothetical protein